jgi:hypothetical protein
LWCRAAAAYGIRSGKVERIYVRYYLLVVFVAVLVFESRLMFVGVSMSTILMLMLVLGVLVIVIVVGVRMLLAFVLMLMLMGLIVTMFRHLVPF